MSPKPPFISAFGDVIFANYGTNKYKSLRLFIIKMTLTIEPVCSHDALKAFVSFPWTVNHGDACWVPPLMDDRLRKLDPRRSPFWQNARRELWIAWQDGRPVGTIAAIVDDGRIRALGEAVGGFGFFDSINDPSVAGGLLDAAAEWLREQGMTRMRGPYSPSTDDECGVLVEGFDTRPAILMGHNPPYYAALIERCGFSVYRDMVARLFTRDPAKTFQDQVPEKLRRVAERAAQRADLRIRTLDKRRWDAEIALGWQIYSTALSALPEYVPIRLENFQNMAAGFRTFLYPDMALIAEIGSRPVGFALALPDVNEALQHVNGWLGVLEMVKMSWYLRQVRRVSFKILMMLPEYQGRGVEAVLTVAVARAIWKRGFLEVDMSMTGSENVKSNRYQENLGFKIYRRYLIYEKEL